ncbi:hypothetical protein [Zavarzinia compransoris]|uniref:Lipoprotein n=1 Tax=Zavarzinia compransoris TaxID=1264899 RepID=A0A317DZN8_9PROT|nr:hypothetical protein [Zavarzinia compransoris]PWR19822.1 hypothetical protein DKG75_15295 [Zavarzinia compransoris]
MRSTKRRPAAVLAALAAALAATACMPRGPAEFNLGRLPGWYRYLAGDDIRQACAAGGPDRVRFVYNAVWTEQVRAYELKFADYGAQVDQYVWGPAALLAGTTSGPQIRAEKANIGIDRARLARLERAMAASDVQGPSPQGKFLRSDNFYWVVASCRQGRFHFNAFQAGDGRFEALTFPEQLFEADRTDIAVNRPRRLDLPPLAGAPDRDDGLIFTVQVSGESLDVARWD